MRTKLPCTTNVTRILASAVVLAVAGCGERYSSDATPDDEAMSRLRWENEHSGTPKTPEEAAKQYFLPKYYYDPNKSDGQGVADYFPGMDRIVVNPAWQPDPKSGPPLDVPVFPLVDKGAGPGLPEFRVETAPLRTNQEILGRNTWMLWCGGNEGFWDWLSTDSLGFIDLLKLVDSRNRGQRFDKGGLINEPGMMQSGGPDRFGVWLDVPADGSTREWRNKHLEKAFERILQGQHPSQRGLKTYRQTEPGISAAGYDTYADASAGGSGRDAAYQYDPQKAEDATSYPPPEIYGFSSGVVGLRLFPNPYFDEEARKKWDAARYYDAKDQDYWNDPHLVRPYRVGVACAYCHASFHPLNPPRDIHNPQWENLSGNIGAQYLRIRVAFANLLEPENFVYHILDSQPPGTIDTSLIASDNINNPNAMNSVFNLPQRALLSLRNPKEVITADSGKQPAIWDYPGEQATSPADAKPPPDWKHPYDDGEKQAYYADPVPKVYVDLFKSLGLEEEAWRSNSQPARRVPRILLDGSDSIGAWGALARVYLNIGTYWEQWQRLHRTVVGFEDQRAFTIADCERHSLYWHATEDRVPALRDYFLKVTPSMPLLATENAAKRIEPIDVDRLRQQARDEKRDFRQLLAAAKARHVDLSQLERGREVFAEHCIVCHSSIQPPKWHQQMDRAAKSGEFWIHDPAGLLADADYMSWAKKAVTEPDFWRLNYLSSDYRVPINVVRTNASRAMATNAIDKNMWDDFASESYQHLPSVGAIEYFNPYAGPSGKMETFLPRHDVRNDAQPGGGGPGFYRVPTLVSIWATAPLLHNNSLGTFNNNPSVDGRLEAFDDAIRKLLWPERRLESSSYNEATPDRLKRDHGLIWRTPEETHLDLSGRRVPTLLGEEVAAVMRISEKYPWLRDIRPLWLPSGILLLASFLLLALGSQKQRILTGAVALVLSAVTFVLGWCCGNASWLSCVYPLWLISGLLFGVGLLFLAIDCPRRLRYLACAALIVGAVGLILYLLGDQWWWLKKLHEFGLTAWLSGLIAVGVVLWLTGLAEPWRRLLGWILVVVAAIGLLVHLVEANVGGPAMSASLGPVWLYLLLVVSAALVLLTPDRRELTRYVGYASLVLSLAFGGLVYFFAGRLGDVHIGPIPQGTPVNLLANLNPDAKPAELLKAVKVTVNALAEIESKHLDEEQAQKVLREKAAPALMEVNKCPDFVMDHGHYFPWFDQMTDDDKDALIELLKTF